MSEKLTFETVIASVGREYPVTAKALWANIEADREAIREEVLKDRGFVVDWSANPKAVAWRPYWIEPHHLGGEVLTTPISDAVRRPPKMRQMTRDEKVNALRGMSKDPMWRINAGPLDRSKLKDETLDDLCFVAGIPTEVADE